MSDTPLTPEQVGQAILETPEWFADDTDSTIARTFVFDDFQTAIVFVNKVAGLAEKERHHPNMHIHSLNKVTISLTTRDIGGLSAADFSLASQIDAILG